METRPGDRGGCCLFRHALPDRYSSDDYEFCRARWATETTHTLKTTDPSRNERSSRFENWRTWRATWHSSGNEDGCATGRNTVQWTRNVYMDVANLHRRCGHLPPLHIVQIEKQKEETVPLWLFRFFVRWSRRVQWSTLEENWKTKTSWITRTATADGRGND